MRTLAVFSLSFSAAVLCARFCGNPAVVMALSAAFFFLFLLFLLFHRRLRPAFLIAAAAASLGFGWFWVYSEATVEQAHKLAGDTRPLAVVTTEYPKSASYGCSVRGVLATEGLPSLGVILYDNTFSAAKSEPGQVLLCSGSIRSADSRYGEQYDGYTSAGVYLLITAKGGVSFGEKQHSLRYIPVRVKNALMKAAERVFQPAVRPFMKSLMLGDKTELYAEPAAEYALSASGIMHIVAVSGMHIAFLAGFIRLLFGASKRSSLVCLAVVWLFVLITGCSPSAVRAGMMHSVLLLAPVFGRENDSLTSLFFALLLLLVRNPFAVMSVSLQLSFASTAGMVLFSGKIRSFLESALGRFAKNRFVQYPVGVIASSLSVMILSVPVTAYHFHAVQLASPLTNALVLWAVSFCFAGGYAACLLSLLMPTAGKMTAVPVNFLARYILSCAGAVSKLPNTSLYTCSDFALYWMLGVYALFLISAFLPVAKKRKVLIPSVVSVLSLILLIVFTARHYSGADEVIAVIDVGQGECVAAFSGENTLMIDCGSIFTADNAGEKAGRYLLSRGRRQIDLLILTHLHEDHVNGVEMLLEYLPVKEIAISAYAKDEDGQLDSIRKAASAHGTPITWLTEEAEAVLGAFSVRMFTPITEGDANACCVISVVSVGECDLLVTGDAPQAAEKLLPDLTDLPAIDFLAVGHHGSRTSTSEELMKYMEKNAKAVISVGYNAYGHPAAETLQTLRSALMDENIYRTDRDGTVQFTIEDCYG